MNILFEGIDCSGKTTLIDNCLSCVEVTSKFQDVHCFRKPTEMPKEKNVFNFLRDFKKNKFNSCDTSLCFIDRYWPSTLVYNDQRFKAGRFDMDSMLYIEAVDSIDYYVLVLVEFDDWLARIQKDSESTEVMTECGICGEPWKKYRELTDGYLKIWSSQHINPLKWAVVNPNVPDFDVKRFLFGLGLDV